MAKNMTFEAALEELKNGEAVGREGWIGKMRKVLIDKNQIRITLFE